jgi:cold shock CspA family protein
MSHPLNQGRVVFFNPNRNFGFVHTPDGREYFFHGSNYAGKPELSQHVSFDVVPAIREGKAPMAIRVTPIDDVVSLLSGGAR